MRGNPQVPTAAPNTNKHASDTTQSGPAAKIRNSETQQQPVDEDDEEYSEEDEDEEEYSEEDEDDEEYSEEDEDEEYPDEVEIVDTNEVDNSHLNKNSSVSNRKIQSARLSASELGLR